MRIYYYYYLAEEQSCEILSQVPIRLENYGALDFFERVAQKEQEQEQEQLWHYGALQILLLLLL